MKYLPVKTKICFMMLCLFFGGILAFSIIGACPAGQAECSLQREPVAFPHEMHMENYDCEDCHHVYDDKKNNVIDTMELYSGNPDIMCSSCHTADSRINTRKAFHRQCMGCHNEEATMEQTSMPTMCNGCHRPEAAVPMEEEMIIRG